MPYVEKNTLRTFHGYFHRLETFNTKFITDQILHEKIIMYFSSIGHHIISYIAKFEVKIPLVRREKKRNLSRGRLDQLKLLGEVH